MGGSQGNEEALKTNLILDNLVKNVSYVQIGLVNTLYVQGVQTLSVKSKLLISPT